MGALLHFPTGGRVERDPPRRPPLALAAPIAIADVVEIVGEALADGRIQTGIVENIVITPEGARLWVRRHGGPRAGINRVIALAEARLAPNPHLIFG